jgi:alkylresorcinol/alkylpyrone synthase
MLELPAASPTKHWRSAPHDGAATDTRHATPCPTVAASSTALPEHEYGQRELAALSSRILGSTAHSEAALARFFDRVGVKSRHLALPIAAYETLCGFGARSRAWMDVALRIGSRAVSDVLGEVGLDASEVGMLMTTTVTGIAVPSLDARLMNLLPFKSDLKRVPLFGLGCLGGAAGLARTSEYLLAFPDEAAILLSVELCSLTLQRDDISLPNLVSAGLFGDGAAAVLLLGARHRLRTHDGSRRDKDRLASGVPSHAAQPRVLASRSVFFPDTERVMGWDMVDTGFKIVLDSEVPALVERLIPGAVDAFLHDHGLSRERIDSWLMHPGGPKVIDALERGLALPKDALRPTRESLSRFGNLSSASVLFLLDEHRRDRAPAPGSYGLMMAMGPAFCAELILLRW